MVHNTEISTKPDFLSPNKVSMGYHGDTVLLVLS